MTEYRSIDVPRFQPLCVRLGRFLPLAGCSTCSPASCQLCLSAVCRLVLAAAGCLHINAALTLQETEHLAACRIQQELAS